ncbi:formate--tetrahydrofolate ligase [Oceanospirillaceae bacterium]|jgi:formate--tetrahydrofolate ligase|nr:formate--tetrahydrofolate ligase [Oceanospirillaceae bacterium]MBT4998333.1 formate--tetrahydrofolate ligase [Oceanospirillaceae bacterium]MBT5629514.1 formate--tetrahydrofolate ligase [Oceanospirillaceae bacterium]MBT6099881.1 formate--tetrahydrofolate ligase [Oceanospirillaceae bacterium]MBT7674930.1 formate--tetrahydrofolate ligase [Oceanospirillaceae bacterium]
MSKTYLSDIDIARAAEKRPIAEVADKLNIHVDDLEMYGKIKAKISPEFINSVKDRKDGKLILVTAINPTPAGEGKTTTTIGLGDALNQIGKQASVCLREPSLGPCFGVKGGAAGGGYAQVVPMEDINLHFTGDFHAIGLAHNLLSAAIDNHLQQGNELNLDPRRIAWKRVMDMNDRALRNVTIGRGGPAHGVPRETGFDITVASEVMAIFCLANTLAELKEKLGDAVVGYTYDQKPVTARDLKVHGAMTVLLKDAFSPNLVQTLEHTPAFVHGGPFANIAHGCNSVVATRLSMKLSDYTVTEAGFGADLGAEKFLDIKCRKAGITPSAVVIVATIRALKLHGGVPLKDVNNENLEAVATGVENLKKHIENIHQFGLPVVVAVNKFVTDTDAEVKTVQSKCDYLGVQVIEANHWADGGKGAIELAETVVDLVENHENDFHYLYEDDMPLWDKVKTVAQKIYGADDIEGDQKLRDSFTALEKAGYGNLPICMAKTQYSFSTDPALKGRPTGFNIPLREVRLSAGAGFIVVLAGDVMTMPGLPKKPAAEVIDINEDGQIVGLF